jgi:hypothetical protein
VVSDSYFHISGVIAINSPSPDLRIYSVRASRTISTATFQMGYLGLGEPGLGTFIIFAGIWINRNKHVDPLISTIWHKYFRGSQEGLVLEEVSDVERASANTSKRRLSNANSDIHPGKWHRRHLKLFRFDRIVWAPNPDCWQQTIASRMLRRFPFIVEVIYWALIYGVSPRRGTYRHLLMSSTGLPDGVSRW